jgi:hypothetical protein
MICSDACFSLFTDGDPVAARTLCQALPALCVGIQQNFAITAAIAGLVTE